MKFCKICILLAAAALFAAACGQSATTPNSSNTATNVNKPANIAAASPSPAADDPVAAGAKLYTTNCMTCHKDSGKGGKVTVDGKSLNPDDLTTAKMKAKSDEKLYEYVSEGAPDDGMPAFKTKLSDAEIKSIVKHLRVLQGG